MRTGLLILAALLLFAAIEALLYAVVHARDRKQAELTRRLQAIGKPAAGSPDLLRRARFAEHPRTAAIVQKLPFAERVEALIEQAGLPWTVARLYATTAAAAFLAPFFAAGLRLSTLAVLLPPVVVAAPFAFLKVTVDRRSRLLSEQLPDALDTMARSLRAGHALSAAFEVVASEMPAPISVEFGRAYEEQRLGLSADAAVRQMAARAPNNGDLQIFAVSVTIQRETGGNLAEILGNIATTVRDRFKFYGKLRALTAEARGSTWVLALLPIGVAGLISVLNPGYLLPLTRTPLGRMIAMYAVVSWFLGVAWLRKMAQLRY